MTLVYTYKTACAVKSDVTNVTLTLHVGNEENVKNKNYNNNNNETECATRWKAERG